MLFLVISTPRPERPSTVAQKLKSRQCRFVYARTGRGAVALFDVQSNDELHAWLNEWAEIIPAHFDIYPLIEPTAARRYLGRSRA